MRAANSAKTVLLAEDEESLVAADGHEAIDLISRYQQEIDIVVLDIGLPNIAG